MRNILYLHGFASSPRGRKVAALRERLEPKGFRVVAPDLNVPSFQKLDFKAMARVSVWEVKKHLPAVVVGSSLGALVALEAVRIARNAPLVLLAPALGLGESWVEKIPPEDPPVFFHHGEGRELPIHRRFFEEMTRVAADREPPPVPVAVLMGRNDESIPFETVREVWKRWEKTGQLASGSRFIELPDGDHGLVDFVDRIAEEIQSRSSQGEPSVPSS
ncbi:MAG: YqiA/YcfP family alpha/beta fold hydrolase [Thermoanaerobaculia bacterium]